MSCKNAKFDDDSGRYECDVTGDGCVYLIPDSKACAKDYGEGPESED